MGLITSKPLMSKRRKGFTLVELLVVIGIIAVLIGMLLPALSKVQQQSKWLKCQSNMRTVGQFLQMYSMQWHGYCYPPSLRRGQDAGKSLAGLRLSAN